jgi:5-methylcytosine-specific restriction endonuclease McrA
MADPSLKPERALLLTGRSEDLQAWRKARDAYRATFTEAEIKAEARRNKEMDEASARRYSARRSERLKAQGNGKTDRTAAFARDNWVCGICGGLVGAGAVAPAPDSPSIDHVVPLSKGDTHTMNNVQAARPLCNSRKQEN